MGFLKEILPRLDWIIKLNNNLSNDLMATLIGAILVIPQAITFAYLAGLPPEYGIYSAIFVTFIASLFGSTPMLGGPNTAVAILIGLAVAPYAGVGSPLFVEYVLILSIMVGIIQLIFWLGRASRVFDFFSPAGISGITAGVGFILIISSIDGILGLSRTDNMFFYEKIYYTISSFNDLVNYFSLSIALATVLSGLIFKSLKHRYYILLAICVGSVYGFIFTWLYPPILSDVELLGYIPMEISFSIPAFTNEHFIVAEQMFVDALIIAFVGISQSLIITKGLSRKLNISYNQNKEVFAQGLSNTISGFFGAFAGSGSFNRTVVNIDVGSRTQIPGILSGIVIFLIVYLFNPIIAHIPMAVISGVLMLVGVAMFDIDKISNTVKVRVDRLVFMLVFLSTILLGLKIGILLSLVISLLIYIINTSSISYSESKYKDISIINVRGNLFYATVDQFRDILNQYQSKNKILINIDNTGLVDPCCVNQIDFLNEYIGKNSVSVLCTDREKLNNLTKLGIECAVFSNFDAVKKHYLVN